MKELSILVLFFITAGQVFSQRYSTGRSKSTLALNLGYGRFSDEFLNKEDTELQGISYGLRYDFYWSKLPLSVSFMKIEKSAKIVHDSLASEITRDSLKFDLNLDVIRAKSFALYLGMGLAQEQSLIDNESAFSSFQIDAINEIYGTTQEKKVNSYVNFGLRYKLYSFKKSDFQVTGQYSLGLKSEQKSLDVIFSYAFKI